MSSVRTRSGSDVSATEAKQGRHGKHLLVILVSALILAAVGWIGVELWGEHIDPDKSPVSAHTVEPSVSRDNAASGAPASPAQIDESENNQQGITSKPDQPSRNGVQN